MRVAVVEDEADIARLYAAILDDAGHDVWHVDQHDLEAIGDAEVVILDLMMPDVDGAEVLAWLGQHKPNIRVVVASAMYRVPESIQSMATKIIAKPFTPQQLLDAL